MIRSRAFRKFRRNRLAVAASVVIALYLAVAVGVMTGGLKALVFQFATLTDVAWQMSGEVILMTLLGGIGTMAGPILGAGLVIALQNSLATSQFPVTIVLGAIFMICVLIFRRGIVGEAYALLRRKT